MNENECCPKFDPTLWDGVLFEMNAKKFIKEKVTTFLYMQKKSFGILDEI